MQNNSPWLFELETDRKEQILSKNIETDVCIVGAGIAGISTAFFILEKTNKNIVIVDKFKLAHGATGHNAGQIVSYFEKPFRDLSVEFGLQKTAEAHINVESGWELLEHMYTDAGLTIPFNRFEGYLGLSTKDQVMLHLENNFLRKTVGLKTEKAVISENAPFLGDIPGKYKNLFTLVKPLEIYELLETINKNYLAVFSYQKGTINSALFCEKVFCFLKDKYKDRINLYEHTDVSKIVLKKGIEKDCALLDTINHTIKAEKVILCTNGFEHLTIINEGGLEIDAKFHHNIDGVVGYMSAYLEKINKPAFASSYFPEESIEFDDDYFYMTRRQYEYEKGVKHNLISIGGPVVNLEDRKHYMRDFEYPEKAKQKIEDFVKETYGESEEKKVEHTFLWHGLMGYTLNKVRLIGPEPKNEILIYNLGCNGIGILPSVYGGSKIARILAGESFSSSIFDPR